MSGLLYRTFAIALSFPAALAAATIAPSMDIEFGYESSCHIFNAVPTEIVQKDTPEFLSSTSCIQTTHDLLIEPLVALVTSYKSQRQLLIDTQRSNSIGVVFELKNGAGHITGRFYQEMLATELDFAIYGVQGNDVSNSWCAKIGKVDQRSGAGRDRDISSVEMALNNRSGLSLSFWSDRLYRTGGWRTAETRATR